MIENDWHSDQNVFRLSTMSLLLDPRGMNLLTGSLLGFNQIIYIKYIIIIVYVLGNPPCITNNWHLK